MSEKIQRTRLHSRTNLKLHQIRWNCYSRNSTAFCLKGWQVRDLVDSLYQGYPTGYLIISKSPDLKLKDGSLSVGKKIMIDGQQRVTAMMTALYGLEVFNENFDKKRIPIFDSASNIFINSNIEL